MTHDPAADVRWLWATVHAYVLAQGSAGDDDGVARLSQAYSDLIDAHNAIYDRWVAPDETPTPIAGVPE